MPARFILAIALIAVMLPGSIYAQSKKKSKRPDPPEYIEPKIRAGTPQETQKFLKKSESRRRAEYDAFVKDFEEMARAIELIEKKARLPRGETNMYLPSYDSGADRKQILARTCKLLADKRVALDKVGGNPAFVCPLANPPGKGYEKLANGLVCRFDEASVISVAGPEEMLVRVYAPPPDQPLSPDRQDIWLSGFSTTGVIDGATLHPKNPILISGTKTYTSAGGASRTVFMAVPFDPSEYIEPVKKKSNSAEIDKFLGRWRIVDEKGMAAFFLTLDESFAAKKSHVPDATGKWEIVGEEVRITWSDGWRDILRSEKDRVVKIAFGPGTGWKDKPTNTERAIKE